MKDTQCLWAVILAAGEGKRISAMTTDAQGVSVPKQYCSFGRPRSMLHWAMDRARAVVPRERICTVVAREHRRWWERELSDLDPGNVIVQPRNRGTAAGVLLPLLAVFGRDPDANVVFIPSDHHVEDEEALRGAVDRAASALRRAPGQLVLLGITPDAVETGYGWILPRLERGESGEAIRPVERFVEKPDRVTAAGLLLRGAVWNSFIFAASARRLVSLYAEVMPGLLEAFVRELDGASRHEALERLYEALPTEDFSRDLLERATRSLGLVVVPPCGWSDLGTPERLSRFMEARPARVGARPAALPA